MFQYNERNRGSALVTMLIAAGIMGILFMAISRMIANNSKDTALVENQIDRLALNRYMMMAADCASTKVSAPSPCSDGTYVAVMTANGAKTLVKKFQSSTPSDVTTIGKWMVRAKCGPSRTLVFEAKLANSSNDFKNLSPNVPFGCVMP